MKLSELYVEKDITGKSIDIKPDYQYRYYIKHTPRGQTGRIDIIDNEDKNRAPVKSKTYNTYLQQEEYAKDMVNLMHIMNGFEKIQESDNDDLSGLPPEIINGLEKNIKEGAKDLTQQWENALELVNKAYEVGYEFKNPEDEKLRKAIPLPTTFMKKGWQQYEDLIAYAVDQLTKSRGKDGDWRMSDPKHFKKS